MEKTILDIDILWLVFELIIINYVVKILGNAQIPHNDGHKSTTTATTAEMPTATEGGDKEEESCDVASQLTSHSLAREIVSVTPRMQTKK